MKRGRRTTESEELISKGILVLTCAMLCHAKCFSGVQLCVTLWTVAPQALLSLGLSRQEYWSGLPFPSPGDLLDPGIQPASLTSPALAEGSLPSATWEALGTHLGYSKEDMSPGSPKRPLFDLFYKYRGGLSCLKKEFCFFFFNLQNIDPRAASYVIQEYPLLWCFCHSATWSQSQGAPFYP